jgi:hypothetical protein
MQHPNGTTLNGPAPEPTAIRVPPLSGQADASFRLLGNEIVVNVMVSYSAAIDTTFPADLVDATELHRWDVENGTCAWDWLPCPTSADGSNQPFLYQLLRSVALGSRLDFPIDADGAEWLRQQAENYINALCTSIRRDRDERGESAERMRCGR